MGRLARILSVALGLFLALLLLGGILGEVESPEDDVDGPVGSGSATPGGTPQAPEQPVGIPTAMATVTMTATVTAEPRPRSTVTLTETVTGALGIAEDGRPAKCFKGKDGRARWGYDSNRG
jgi:hypothetical protein